jgi:hypothetical protein
MNKVSVLSGFAATILLVTGCASSPDKIDAAYVSPVKYQSYQCDQVATEMDYVGHRTTKLYHRLEKERTADNWQMGIGLVLFWPSLFLLEGGDGPEAAEYAQLKGEYEALRETSVSKQCHIASKSPEQILKEADKVAKNEAKEEVVESGAKHKQQVLSVASAMECQSGISLQSVGKESETWMLACGDGESLTVRCFDEDCYVKQ